VYVFQAETLRLRRVQLRLPAGELLDYTGKDDPDESAWQVRFTACAEDPHLWQLRLEQTTDAVRREVLYWVHLSDAEADSGGPTEPVFASETAFDAESGHCLFRAQSMDWQLHHHDAVHTIDMARTAGWVLHHLDAVYDPSILGTCADHFFHNPEKDGETTGYSNTVACTDRSIELDPRAIDLYTTNAWLLWSDWVSWKLDPQRVSNGRDKLDRAVRLIKKGRAANPASAAYHFDAANTMAPLALHHRPDLMDWVIHYYHHAEALATDRAQRAQICKVLGHRYRIQGKIEEAIRWYRITLELDPENEVAERYLKQLQK
jgi:tetratricopeptide (TPR) repeat protein